MSDGTITDNQRRHFICAIFSYRTVPILNRNYVVSANRWCRSWALRSA